MDNRNAQRQIGILKAYYMDIELDLRNRRVSNTDQSKRLVKKYEKQLAELAERIQKLEGGKE